ncbi:MAG: desulfoferrodoxin family protein [Pirellulaceae bacterium]
MSERRRFLKTIAAGPAAALLLPMFSQTGSQTMAADAECAAGILGKLPENIIYTKDRQGVWKGKSGGHVPRLSAKKEGDKFVLDVETPHGMSEEHYIVRHSVVAACGKVLGAKTFHWKDEPSSRFEIELPAGDACRQLMVMSYCNLHDLWLLHTELDV